LVLSQEHAQFCQPSLDNPFKLSPSTRLSERQLACGEGAHAILFNLQNSCCDGANVIGVVLKLRASKHWIYVARIVRHVGSNE
jgi:hypothetical protein